MIGQFSLFAVLAVALVAETVNSALVPAAPDEFGDHVSLRVNGSHICSGGRHGRNHVMTSAKCVIDLKSKEELVIVLGSLSSTSTNGAEIYTARRIVIHPEFKRENPISHDIAVIVLDRDISARFWENRWYMPSHYISARIPGTLTGNLTGTVTGWRWSTYNVSSSNTELLKKVTVKTITTEECQRYEPIVGEGQICASVESGHGSCVADGGAPLVIDNAFEGILSDGNPCGGGTPGIFTRFGHYVHWAYNAMYASTNDSIPTTRAR